MQGRTTKRGKAGLGFKGLGFRVKGLNGLGFKVEGYP